MSGVNLTEDRVRIIVQDALRAELGPRHVEEHLALREFIDLIAELRSEARKHFMRTMFTVVAVVFGAGMAAIFGRPVFQWFSR